MRTNVVLNDALIEEAQRLSGRKSRREVLEEALRTYVQVRNAENRRESYRERLSRLDAKMANVRLRQSSIDLLREDRDRT